MTSKGCWNEKYQYFSRLIDTDNALASWNHIKAGSSVGWLLPGRHYLLIQHKKMRPLSLDDNRDVKNANANTVGLFQYLMYQQRCNVACLISPNRFTDYSSCEAKKWKIRQRKCKILRRPRHNIYLTCDFHWLHNCKLNLNVTNYN